MDTKSASMLLDAGISLRDPAPGLAARVLNLAHFKAFLLATPKPKRKAAYEALKPRLKFKVPSYSLLIGSQRTRKSKTYAN